MEATWDKIAEEFAFAFREGRTPTVDDFLTHYDDPTGELRELLESIAMIEGLKQNEKSRPKNERPITTPKIKQLDDYKIVREIGRGGMGIVFEAIHQSLGRRVAIKIFSATALDDERMLKRFRQEAQAAAQLTHSNIVPVYGVGHCDSYHYYVMDLIDGLSLRQWLEAAGGQVDSVTPTIDESAESALHESEVITRHGGGDFTIADQPIETPIRNLPKQAWSTQYFRCVAEKIADVCDALDYAHRQGTLHRDIKPANLLFDHQGSIWVTDFGLAKLEEPSNFTRTGDIVGTPQYMPPESFEGKYDERSEVYAAGLTLFEMLTLRPAIDVSSQAEAIRRAISGVSVSPRKIVPSIPRDLDTITMKALAVEPERRYRSMRALRDDLRRYLSHRSISAKRSSPLERLVRWSHREPLAATLTGAVFVSITALAIVSLIGFYNTRSLLKSTQELNIQNEKTIKQREAALEDARQQNARATKNLSVAIEAFDQIMANVAQRGADLETESFGDIGESTSPDVSAADAEMLQSLLGFFDELADNNSEDFQSQSAAALRRVGDIYQRLGQLKQADDAYSSALKQYQATMAISPSDDVMLAQAEILNEQANIAGLRAQVNRASQLYRQTMDLLTEDDRFKDSNDAAFQYARANAFFASIVSRAGIEMPLSARRPLPFRRFGMREPIRLPKQSSEHLRAINDAIEVFEGLADENPEDTKYQVALARAYRDQAKIAMRRQQPTARESINRAIDIFRELHENDPSSDAVRYEYTKTLCSTEALAFVPMVRLASAMRMTNELLDKHPEMARYRELKAIVLGQLADVHIRRGELDLAIRQADSEFKIRSALIDDYPDRVAYQIGQCRTLERLSDLYRRKKDMTKAFEQIDTAIDLLDKIAESGDAVGPQARNVRRRLMEKRSKIE